MMCRQGTLCESTRGWKWQIGLYLSQCIIQVPITCSKAVAWNYDCEWRNQQFLHMQTQVRCFEILTSALTRQKTFTRRGTWNRHETRHVRCDDLMQHISFSVRFFVTLPFIVCKRAPFTWTQDSHWSSQSHVIRCIFLFKGSLRCQ